MGIAVIDQGPDLFWFVSNALLQDEIPLRHLQTIVSGEECILHDLPEIVIINGDDKNIQAETFISRMRNHVFARNTIFIVVTADTSIEFKKTLLIAGAGQILYRGRGFSPSPKFFASLIKWFLNFKEPDPAIFDYKPVLFPAEAEYTSFGRLGWISSTHCMIECNVNLTPGQTIEFKNSLFEELEIKNLELECVEKNKVGRYYQYANSILCKINTKDSFRDPRKINTWIKDNHKSSKHKPIKLVYFESDPTSRDAIKKIIKKESRYCARGYGSIDDLVDTLNYQLPQLVLINRALIAKDKTKFEAMKNFVKTNFCFCITYSDSEIFKVEEFKKEYEFAMHAPTQIDSELLDSMVEKLEKKLPDELKTDDKKHYFSKHSSYSRISLHSPCKITELAQSGAGIELPFSISNFCACEISSNAFSIADMNRNQFFRAFNNKPGGIGFSHRMIFMGQNVKDNEQVKSTIQTVARVGHERWLIGDTKD